MDILHRLNPFSSNAAKGTARSHSPEDDEQHAAPVRSRTPSKLRTVLSHTTFSPSPRAFTMTVSKSTSAPHGISSPSFLHKSLGRKHKLKNSTSAPFLSLAARPSTPSPSRKRSTKTPTKDQIGTPQAPGAYAFKTWHSNAHLCTPRPDSPSDLCLDFDVEQDSIMVQTPKQDPWAGKLARRLRLSTPERATVSDVSPRQTHSSTPLVPPLYRSLYETHQHPHPPPRHSFPQAHDIHFPLAYVDDLPNGTPGGHRSDLAKGVLRDDVRSANDGIRFFSRDMYASRMTSLSPSPSPLPTPSPRQVASVTKRAQRVSVDACGTPTKLVSPRDDSSDETSEESEEEDDAIRPHGRPLDTIDESPASSTAGEPRRRSKSPASLHADLEARLQSSEALVAQLGERNSEMLDNCQELKRTAQDVAMENEIYAAQVERLREEVERRRTAEDELVSELGSRRIQLEAQTELRDALFQSRSQLDAAKHTIIAQHARLDAVLDRLEGSDEPQDSRVETVVVKLAAGITAQQRVLELESSANVASQELVHTRSDLAAAENTIAFQNERYEALLDRLEGNGEPQADPRVEALFVALLKGAAAQERVIDLERGMSALGDKLGTTRFERDMLAIKLEAADAELHSCKLQVGDLTEKETNASDNVVRLEALQTSLQEQLEAARLAQRTLDSRCQVAEMALETKSNELIDAQNQCAQLRIDLGGVREELQAAQSVTLASELLRSDNNRLMELQQNELAQSAITTEDLRAARDELEGARLEIARLEDMCPEAALSGTADYEHEAVVSSLNSQIHTLTREIALRQTRSQDLQRALAEADDALTAKIALVSSKNSEIDDLRGAAADAEEALVRAHEDAERQESAARRLITRLENEIADIKMEKQTHADALANAMRTTSMERMQLAEANTRCLAYKEQVERSYADEAKRREDIAQARRDSANAELRVMSLEKEVAALKDDKESLDVALDSKQQEIELIKRRYAVKPTSTPASRSSLSRTVPMSSAPRRNHPGIDETPMQSRRMTLSSSTSSLYRQPLGMSTKSNATTPVAFTSKLKSPVRRMSLTTSVGKP